jgi:polyhydroxyalkanoate synthase
VATAAKARMEGFVRGVARYQDAPQPDSPAPPAPVWTQGAAALRYYGGTRTPVLVVPSLINRATVLDLSADRSFLRALARADIATYLLDWGTPGADERGYDVAAYITRVLLPALHTVAMREKGPVHLAGYCLGGTLVMAPAVLAPAHVAGLILLAAPWDFHADNANARAMLTAMRPLLEMVIAANGVAPVDLLQALFASLDPSLVGRKFRAFAALDPASEEARRFVALEDWLNDGVPLAGPVARELLFAWYGANAPLLKRWRIGDTPVDPAAVKAPALVMIPSQDRIVPPRSASALADALPNAEAIRVPLGHIGMMAGGGASQTTFAPIVRWLQSR